MLCELERHQTTPSPISSDSIQKDSLNWVASWKWPRIPTERKSPFWLPESFIKPQQSFPHFFNVSYCVLSIIFSYYLKYLSFPICLWICFFYCQLPRLHYIVKMNLELKNYFYVLYIIFLNIKKNTLEEGTSISQ